MTLTLSEALVAGRLPDFIDQIEAEEGGTNGNGPNILAGGVYPHPLSRIGMAHDTDWTLGRVFGAGPMRTLATSSDPRGDFGLTTQGANRSEHQRSLDAGIGSGYLSGHADWNVQYLGR